ncbi:serine/threonine protein kinase [Deinobacterium chartae]|uniref:Serine/threonine protein kinase n=1 Tax=Deinobacterium chartae TaxID=521158 RepID=A0A841I430_9DEIO|nr:serine/threonine-protein kinase [Deinobacterium chartae]MBB6099148.1 serine/threonine protein kinase [Deinobacterium chartae]
MAIPGTVLLGRYRIVRPFAHGSSSVVYLAFDSFGKPYAFKLFPKSLEPRADREYHLTRHLSHPLINPVRERINLEDQPGLLMDFAPGEVLSRAFESPDRYPVMQRGLASRRDAYLSVLLQTLEALAYLHDRGIVHRDIKPENLIVAPSGDVRLVDFDLSGPAGEVFREKLSMGTVGYMSPEQAMGRPLTPSADLYSLGVLLYWGLSGQLPFYGSGREVLLQHVRTAPRDPRQVRGGERDPLDSVCLKLLEKDPARRPQSAREVIDTLHALG